jgi:type I site-specific restriction-modification system R (restriction) subunit
MSELKIKHENGQQKVFDIVRKKYVALTPEEKVRQLLIHYLIQEKNYPKNLLVLEHEFRLNGLSKRADIVVMNTEGIPLMLIETKAPDVHVTQKAIDQIVSYNLHYKVKFLLITNGSEFLMYRLQGDRVIQLPEIPSYNELLTNV